jgi:branched-subunit amino acid transport protein
VTWVAIGVLAVGTYAMRLAGPLLHSRITMSEAVKRYLSLSAMALLAALIATAALVEDGGFAGIARPAGLLVGAVLAWRRFPFVLVVVSAAATAALLRLAGL